MVFTNVYNPRSYINNKVGGMRRPGNIFQVWPSSNPSALARHLSSTSNSAASCRASGKQLTEQGRISGGGKKKEKIYIYIYIYIYINVYIQ